MKPRTVHLLILSVLCVAPCCFGMYLVEKNQDSHANFAELGVMIGVGLIVASAVYVGVSSLLVWKLSSTPAQVFAVHAGIVAVLALMYFAPRLIAMGAG